MLRFEYDQLSNVCFLIVNSTVIELSIISHNSSLFKNAENYFFILLIHADGLFPRLVRNHCEAIAIKGSYVKKYNREQRGTKKDAKVLNKFFYPFGPVQYY